jgi:hypothetical protein
MFQKLLKNPSNRFQPVNSVEYIKNDKCNCVIRLIDWDGLISGTVYLVEGSFRIDSSIKTMLDKGMLFRSLLVKDIIKTFVFSSCIKSFPVSDMKDFDERYSFLKKLIEHYNKQISDALKVVVEHSTIYESLITNKSIRVNPDYLNEVKENLRQARYDSDSIFKEREIYVKALNFDSIVNMLDQMNKYRPFENAEDKLSNSLFKNF